MRSSKTRSFAKGAHGIRRDDATLAAAALGTQAVYTMSGAQADMQLVAAGAPLARLLLDAHTRARHADLRITRAHLPRELGADLPPDRAQRNVYGMFPPDRNPDERRMAGLLDGDPQVNWWHRDPSQKPGVSVALYAWDEGEGFVRAFVVGSAGRKTPGGIAPQEVKGPRLWAVHQEPDKAEAAHPDCGHAFIAGHRRGGTGFLLLRKGARAPEGAGTLALKRLRWT